MRAVVLVVALSTSAGLHADVRGDYATQWPLQLPAADAGAYRVVLDAAVYRTAADARLRDVQVVDAGGTPVPSAVFAASDAPATRTERVALPWFALPAAPSSVGTQGWDLDAQVDPDGRLRGVRARVSGMTADALPRNVFIVDASQLRAPIRALRLQWAPHGTLDAGYRVDASDDLDRWRPLPERGRLVDLRQGGTRLLQPRIEVEIDGPPPRYLRLTPDRNDTRIELTGVEAEVQRDTPVALRWLDLPATRAGDAPPTFAFTLDARVPVAQVDVALPGNHAVEWTLDSRAHEDATWTPRIARWVAYGVGDAGRATRSPARMLPRVTRDRHWRLQSRAAVPASPVLRIGYRPEVVVFVAQGRAPYALVAGSARVTREAAPLAALLASLKANRGADWQPAQATLGAPVVLAGDAARSATPPRDWRGWMLWAVLVLGALAVVAFAVRVLRSPETH